jgi:hypothetical protein
MVHFVKIPRKKADETVVIGIMGMDRGFARLNMDMFKPFLLRLTPDVCMR